MVLMCVIWFVRIRNCEFYVKIFHFYVKANNFLKENFPFQVLEIYVCLNNRYFKNLFDVFFCLLCCNVKLFCDTFNAICQKKNLYIPGHMTEAS